MATSYDPVVEALRLFARRGRAIRAVQERLERETADVAQPGSVTTSAAAFCDEAERHLNYGAEFADGKPAGGAG